jgi:hypothetical protein
MTMALYVLVAVSGLIEVVVGIALAVFGISGTGPSLLREFLQGSSGTPSGANFLLLFAAVACLAAAALHGLLLRWLLQEREEAHPLLQGYGAFALVGGVLLFVAFGAHGAAWLFLGIDALRGLLLLGLSVVVAVSPNTVKELRLPSVRGSRVERGYSRVERGRSRVEHGDRGRGRGRGRESGRDRGRGGRGAGWDGGRTAAREAGGRGAQGRPAAESAQAQVRAPQGRPPVAPMRERDDEERPGRRPGGRHGGRVHRRPGDSDAPPLAGQDRARDREALDVAASRAPDRPSTRPSRFDDDSFDSLEAPADTEGFTSGAAQDVAPHSDTPERPRGTRSRRGGRGRGRSGRGGRDEPRDQEGLGGGEAAGGREDRGGYDATGRRRDRGGRRSAGRGGGSRGGRGRRSGGREGGGREGSREREDRDDIGPRSAAATGESRSAAGVRPPWMAVASESGDEGSRSDRAAGPAAASGGDIDYSGRRRKKGRYSTGALFRPREKRERLQRGGRWDAEPRTAWGDLAGGGDVSGESGGGGESKTPRPDRSRPDAGEAESARPEREAGNPPRDASESADRGGWDEDDRGEKAPEEE